MGVRRPVRPTTALLAGAGAALAVAVAALALLRRAWRNAERLVVRPRVVALPGWPPTLDGLTIGVLADLHAGAPQVGPPMLDRVAAATRAAGPELIVILGDLVDPNVAGGRPLAPEVVAERLAALRAPLGVWAVLGNHDLRIDGERVRRALEDAGVRVLENEAAAVERGGETLWLAAIGDEASGRAAPGAALGSVPAGDPVVAITHSPDVFPRVPPRVALTLAGHTHAGQLNIPVLRKWAIPSRFGDRYAGGLIEEDGRRLFVHPGIGTSKWPLRLRADPEVAVLTLVGEPAAASGSGPPR